jgi:predicted transcriptional regulator
MSQTLELEINELRSEMARISEECAQKMADLTKRLEGVQTELETASVHTDSGRMQRGSVPDLILRTLAKADNGKPGNMAVSEIMRVCNLSKGSIHTAINTLEESGMVWVRNRKDPSTKHRANFVYHRDAKR